MKPWENEEFVKEVYTQTKKRLVKEYQTNVIALFHIGNHIEAYMEDADTVSGILDIAPWTKIDEVRMVQFPDADLEVSIGKLTDAGLGISLSEIRDENGNYYLDAYLESPSDTPDRDGYESEYQKLISNKYKKQTR